MWSLGTLTAVAVLIGATCGARVAVPSEARWLLLILLLAAATCWHRDRARLVIAFLLTGFALAAALLAHDARDRALHSRLRDLLDARYGHFALATPAGDPAPDPLPTRFEVVEDAAPIGDVVTLRVVVLQVALGGRTYAIPAEGVRLTIAGGTAPGRIDRWRAGRIGTAPVVFRRPAAYFDDGVGDAERELLLDGTVLFGTIKSGLLVEVAQPGTVVSEAAASVRAHVRRAVTAYVTERNPIAGAIVTAILIGDRTGLPDDVRTRLQAAGTYHVIAISGGNIALVTGLALACLFLLRVPGRFAAGITIVLLAFHAEVVTGGPSVWRATIMAVVYLGARMLDHRTQPWQAIAVSGVLIVLWRPLDVADPGFILTFGATAALLEGGRRMQSALRPGDGDRRHGRVMRVVRRLLVWAGMSIAASLAVEVALLPASAELFSRVSLAGAVLNLLAVPLMAIVQVAGTLVVCLASIPICGRVVGMTAALAADALVNSARLVDLLPMLAPRVPAPGLALVVSYYGGLALCVARKGRTVGIPIVAVAAVCIVSGTTLSPGRSAAPPVDQVRLTVLDVGQGESLLLEVPQAPPLLVDAGGAPFGASGDEIGSRVVAPALWARGVRALGALVITHGDPDHIGGAASVVRDFAPPRLWLGVPMPTHAPTRDLIRRARDRHAATKTLYSGSELSWGRARIRVLNPPVPDWERPRVRNDDSIVLDVRFGDVSLLLTGDIGADVERTLLPQLPPARIRILKVAHHGSRTSSSTALLDGWRPQIAIISCGRGNRFGHPTTEVLARLTDAGARIYRTDLDGEVTVETDGRGVRVRTWMERRE